MLTTLRLANGTAIETTQDLSQLLPMLLATVETPKAAEESSTTPKAATPKAAASAPKERRTTTAKPSSTKRQEPKAQAVTPIDRKQALADLRSLGKKDPMAAAKQAAAFGWSQEAEAWTKRATQEPKAAQEPKAPVYEAAPPKAEQVKAAKQQRRSRKADAAKQDAVAAATAKRDLAEEAPKVQPKPKPAPKAAKVVRSTIEPKAAQEIVTDPQEFTATLFAAKTKRIIAEGGDAILSQISEWEADAADVQDSDPDAEFVRRTYSVNLGRLYKALDAITAA